MLAIPLTVIVIFVVVWIISNVIRAQQDAAQAAARRSMSNRSQRAEGRAPEKTTASDIDRFLQEIDRLRRKEGPPSGHSAAGPAVEEPPRPRPQSKRSQPRQKLSERKPAPPPPPPPVKPLVPELAPEPVRRPSPVEIKHPDVLPPVRPTTPSKPARPMQAASPKSAALELIQTMFKNRQGAAAAVLLHEILGPPKSRRQS